MGADEAIERHCPDLTATMMQPAFCKAHCFEVAADAGMTKAGASNPAAP